MEGGKNEIQLFDRSFNDCSQAFDISKRCKSGVEVQP